MLDTWALLADIGLQGVVAGVVPGSGAAGALPVPAAGARPRINWTSNNHHHHHTDISEGFGRYGGYSLFAGSNVTPLAHQRQASTYHKVSESLLCGGGGLSAAPGSPLSFASAQQIELLAKTYSATSSAILLDQHEGQGLLRTKQATCCAGDINAHADTWDAPLHGTMDTGSSILQPLSIKTENLSSVGKKTASPLKKFTPVLAESSIAGGFSRANPIAWTTTLPLSPAGQTLQVHVKREPVSMSTGCHMSDHHQLMAGALLSASASASHTVLPMVKLEQSSPTSKHHDMVTSIAQHTPLTNTISSLNNGSIPVGIAVARQRAPHELAGPQPPSAGGPPSQPHPNHMQLCKDSRYDIDGAAMTVGVPQSMGGSLMHCDDRATSQIAAWPVSAPPPAPVAPPPALWQYPAPGQMALESMMVGGMTGAVPPAGGFQLIRDPATGTLLLIPAPDQFQQAVVWGSYPPTSVLLPPPPPLAPLQLLGGADLLATASTTLHQHTQTHSTRLVALTADAKRPKQMQLPSHALIKIESDQSAATTVLDACQATQCTKALQTVSAGGGMFGADPSSLAPLLTTHVFYQPQANFVHISQAQTETVSACRSQATSPVACVSSPSVHHDDSQDISMTAVQDASNQTDAPAFDDDDTTVQSTQSQRDLTDAIHTDNAVEDIKNFAAVRKRSLESISDECIADDLPDKPVEVSLKSEINKNTELMLHVFENSSLVQRFTENTVDDNVKSTNKSSEAQQECTNNELILSDALQREALNDNNSSSGSSHDLVIDSDRVSPETIKETSKSSDSSDNFKPLSKMDLSGLELLSSSIEQFETRAKGNESLPAKVPGLSMPLLSDPVCATDNGLTDVKSSPAEILPFIIIKNSPKSPIELSRTEERHFNFPSKPFNTEVPEDSSNLGGLGLLCALAEQRFMEEVEDQRKIEKSAKLNGDIKIEKDTLSKDKFSKETKYSICDKRHSDSETKYNITKCLTSSRQRSPSSHRNNSSTEKKMPKLCVESSKTKYSHILKDCDDTRRMSLEERPSRSEMCSKMEKRRLSAKSRSSSASSVDNAELIESLDTSYRRVARCSCKNGREANHYCKKRNKWPTTVELMNAMELDMRIRLADLQRRYKEKQRKLNRLSPAREREPVKRGPGRPRKKSTASERCNSSQSGRHSSPSVNSSFNEHTMSAFSPTSVMSEEDSMRTQSCDVDLDCDNRDISKDMHKRKLSPVTDSNSSQSSLDKESSSSKKRKVGRPKKLLSTPGSNIATETIVAKKPKSKSSLVGYLLAAKSRLNMSTNKGGIIYSKTNPPRPSGIDSSLKQLSKAKTERLKMTAQESNCFSKCASSPSENKYPSGYEVKQKYTALLSKAERNVRSNVRPKLKAETKVKEYSEEDDMNNDWCNSQTNLGLAKSNSSSLESLHEVRMKNKEKTNRLAMKHKDTNLPKLIGDDKSYSDLYDSSDNDHEPKIIEDRLKSAKPEETIVDAKPVTETEKTASEVQSVCKLTEAHLNLDNTRVLTAMGGLFYAGRLSAIEAPDVYAVTLDGERGNRPHILSREEILRDAILEVCPPSTKELLPGTRLCAYWSQQYRCLYPGTVAEPSSPDPETDDKFVPVEFDDGDSGRISIEDIRLLQPDYPIVEYDPNPLLTLGKRRRQTSVNSTEDKKVANIIENSMPIIYNATADNTSHTTDKSHSDEERYKEKKKVNKKHRKDKIRHHQSRSADENSNGDEMIRKKKKKHKCCDEHCKHRKHHKKHRKHRKHHHSSSKEHSSSSSEDQHHTTGKILLNLNSGVVEYASRPVDLPQINIVNVEEKVPLKTTIPKIKKLIKKSILKKKPNANLHIDKTTAAKAGSITSLKKIKKIVVKGKKLQKDNLKDSGIGLDVDDAKPIIGKVALKKDKMKKRTVSTTSAESVGSNQASKMAAFLPGTQLWGWHGVCHKRTAAKGRIKKSFYKAIQRGKEIINVGDSAVFLSTGRPDRPYIGQVAALWSGRQKSMAVRVKWYYHPEETSGCPGALQYPGGLFESPHTDENDVQTISHKCEVLPFSQYRAKFGEDHQKYASVYDNNDTYYLAGHYDPTQQVLKMEREIPFALASSSSTSAY